MTTSTIVAIVAAVLVMGIGGLTTSVDDWYRDLRKARLNPPNWLFGPAWGIILSLAAWSGAWAWSAATDNTARAAVLGAFGFNIVAHLLWSPLFFQLRRPDWALIELPFLWLSVVIAIVVVAPLSAPAAWLLAPYLVWVSFAAYLNLMVVRLNPPFGAQTSPVRRT